MIPERYTGIVKRLAQRTDEGEVNWKSTSHEKTFVVDFKQFSLSISSYYDDRDSRDCVHFRILGSGGEEMDDFHIGEGESEWGLAYGLYSEARRAARKIDLVIGDITKELESEGPVGEEDVGSES